MPCRRRGCRARDGSVFFRSPCSFSCCAQTLFQGSVGNILSISSPRSTHCSCDTLMGCDCECCPGFHRRNQGRPGERRGPGLGVASSLPTGKLWKEGVPGGTTSELQHPGRGLGRGWDPGMQILLPGVDHRVLFQEGNQDTRGGCYLQVISVRSIEAGDGG